MKTAIFPGSFDPVTNGHLDVIKRASKIFDKLLVCVAINSTKSGTFSTEERISLIKTICKQENIENIEVISISGLLVEAVHKHNACAVVRGLRAVSDFEFEFQMALMNRELDKACETMFMMPSPEYSFVSSSIIKELINFDGDISPFVHKEVIKALKEKKNDKVTT